MNKKIITKVIVVTLLVVLLFTFGACSKQKGYVKEMKNSFVENKIDKLIVRIQVVDGNISLLGEYNITSRNGVYEVQYTYQKQNTFTMQNGEIVAPDEEISYFSGTATVENGVITQYSGDPLNIKFVRLKLSVLNFDVANFGTIDCEYQYEGLFKYSNTYRGEITNPKAFAGIDTDKMTFTAVCGAGIDYNTFSMSYVDDNNVNTVITYLV